MPLDFSKEQIVGTFAWAVEMMKEGKKVRRKDWGGQDIFLRRNFQLIIYSDGEEFNTDFDDIEATNWEIYEEHPCKYCGGDTRIRNPTGKCDHLHYPENVNKDYPNVKSLSDHIRSVAGESTHMISRDRVKEAVGKLKQRLPKIMDGSRTLLSFIEQEILWKEIDKIFGEKLV